MGSIFPNGATLGRFLRPAPLERKAEAMTQPDMAATMTHHKKWRELRAEVTVTTPQKSLTENNVLFHQRSSRKANFHFYS